VAVGLTLRINLMAGIVVSTGHPEADVPASGERHTGQTANAPSMLSDSRVRRLAVVCLLMMQAALLAWQGYRCSPVIDEPGHLVAGISHWKFERFDLYRVNPPLVRLVAALPMLLVDPKADWSTFTENPYGRPEFSIGYAFTTANGFETFRYFMLARWACLPFCLIGSYYCFRWGSDLYGAAAGMTSLALWCFCPNILGNGALITPDTAAAALGVTAGYYFWRWLRRPTWTSAFVAGLILGVAELTKSTWIILVALWPFMWLVWRVRTPRRRSAGACEQTAVSSISPRLPTPDSQMPSFAQLSVILLVALYVLNLGYGFEKSCRRLDRFQFISRALGGPKAHEQPGNRFTGTWLGSLPVPLPENYVIGLDVQRFDFERGKWSYLRGEHKEGGWWYYYLYAMLVKMPVGTLVLLALTMTATVFRVTRAVLRAMRGCASGTDGDDTNGRSWRDECVLLAPALLVILFVSSQTGFNRYLRYVLPAFPFLFIWAGQLARHAASFCLSSRSIFPRASCSTNSQRLHRFVPLLLTASIISSLSTYPHSLSYFNECAGGPLSGHEHLADGNIDWGQDLLHLRHWCLAHPDARPLYLVYNGSVDPKISEVDFEDASLEAMSASKASFDGPPKSGWCAISIHELYGQKESTERYGWLQRLQPVARVGYSILVYHVP
jgi:hypothetical protein